MNLNLYQKLLVKNGTSVLVLCLSVLVGCLSGCKSAGNEKITPTEAYRTIRDDLGRELILKKEIKRVISLAPSVTELIFEAGGGEKLVGVTTYCNYPEAVRNIAKVGDTQIPSLEKIVALEPDMVFISKESQLERFSGILAEKGIQVYVVDPKSPLEIPEEVRRLGEVLSTEKLAEQAASALEKKLDNVLARAKQITQRPRVFIQISEKDLFTAGKDSFITKIVELAGGKSVTDELNEAYPKLSAETAMRLNPDIILLSESEDNLKPNKALSDSNAYRNGKIIKINADILSRPGPRSIDAIAVCNEGFRNFVSN
jgi:iron complex transport system substrate-binding protein